MFFLNTISKFYQWLTSIGVTDELPFSEKLRVELNNLFLGIALPCIIFHLIYNTLGPRLLASYLISGSWLLIFLVPLWLNYLGKYTFAKLYTIIIPLLGTMAVHLLHGWGIRIESVYLLLILISFFFFKKKRALVLSAFVILAFVIVAVLLLFIQPPLANKLLPTVPLLYYTFTVISAVFLVGKVLTENNKFNAITNAQNNSLAKKNNQLENFTYIASHDLKTPIRNIVSFAGLLERSVKRKQYSLAEEHLAYVTSSADQMSALVKDILQISSFDYSREEVRTETDLNDVLKQTIQSLQNELLRRNAIIDCEDLPVYLCNKDEFCLVFQNMLQNGIKYNEAETPTIKLWYTQSGNELRIHIEDNGIGIEEAYQKQVFDFFKRLHTSDKYQGTGLGLGLCKRIIESYQGHILLSSSLGKGSIFTIVLPLKLN